MSEHESAPYGTPAAQPATTGEGFSLDSIKKIRTVHLARAKAEGEKFTMLTCYDYLTAQIFDRAGIEMLLVGDSAANVVFGYDSTLSITLDEIIPLVGAVSRASRRAMVVADLPFGSYEQSPQQAVASAVRLVKEGGAQAVKMEADASMAPWVRALVSAGIPVLAHIGFTPQSEHALGGFRVQGRDGAHRVVADARALVDAGAFCLLMEMVTAETTRAVLAEVGPVPIIGIGAGGATDGQVLVWQDAMGLRSGRMATFVKQFARTGEVLEDAARAYRDQVRSGEFPGAEHTFN